MSDEKPDPQPPESPPPVLNYNSGRYVAKKKGTGGQITLGFLAWVLAVVASVCGMGAMGNILPSDLTWLVPATILTALIGLSIWLRVKFGWRGFIPGLLLGFGLTCLVPIGILAVICGPNMGRW